MLAMYLIDLDGTSSERSVRIKEYAETLKKACEKAKVKFVGQYGAANDKYHYMILMEGATMADLTKPFMETKRPEWLYHIEWKFYG
jgi:hypothetical protein